MLEFNAAKFFHVLLALAKMQAAMKFLRGELQQAAARGDPIDLANAPEFRDDLREIGGQLDAMGLRLAKKTADKLGDFLTPGPNKDYDELLRLLEELESRFRDDLDTQIFLALSPGDVEKFNPTGPLFGEDVADKFPTSLFDIEEAGKCMAIGRYTACVFHLMRAAEASVAVLAVKLGATVSGGDGETLSWGKLTANIRDKIEAMPKGQSKDEWHAAFMFLVSCNRSFRTKTAHPVATYTGEQAREIFDSTRAFMRSVVTLV